MSGVLKVLPDQDLGKLIVTACLDSAIMPILLNDMSTSFSSFSNLARLATVYIITTALSQPLNGRLTDIRGRRCELILSNAIFGGGNLTCGLATSEAVLLVRGDQKQALAEVKICCSDILEVWCDATEKEERGMAYVHVRHWTFTWSSLGT